MTAYAKPMRHRRSKQLTSEKKSYHKDSISSLDTKAKMKGTLAGVLPVSVGESLGSQPIDNYCPKRAFSTVQRLRSALKVKRDGRTYTKS